MSPILASRISSLVLYIFSIKFQIKLCHIQTSTQQPHITIEHKFIAQDGKR